MAKLKPGYQELRKTPAWATYVKRRWPDGRVLNVEGEMWLYRTVPMGPVEDARSPELSAIVGETLRAAFDELATMAGPIKLTRRQTSKGAYRDVHVLLVNVPRLFTPDPDAPLAGYHLQQFPHTVVDRRILLVGEPATVAGWQSEPEVIDAEPSRPRWTRMTYWHWHLRSTSPGGSSLRLGARCMASSGTKSSG